MNELDSKARALLRATQFADEPSQEDYDRVHAAITARIAVGVVAGAAVTAVARTAAASAPTSTVVTGTAGVTAGSAVAGAGASSVGTASIAAPALAGAAGTLATGAASTLPIIKVVAWVLAASMTAGIGAGAVVVTRGRGTDSPMARAGSSASLASSPAHVRAAVASVAVPGSDLVASPAPRSTTPGIAAPVAPAIKPSLDRTEARSSAPGFGSNLPPTSPSSIVKRETPPASSAASLEAEVALVRDARGALSHEDAAHALALLDDHARRFPEGAMAEDRDALQVFATCAAGQPDAARELAVRFLSMHAASPYAASVRASCASPSATMK